MGCDAVDVGLGISPHRLHIGASLMMPLAGTLPYPGQQEPHRGNTHLTDSVFVSIGRSHSRRERQGPSRLFGRKEERISPVSKKAARPEFGFS